MKKTILLFLISFALQAQYKVTGKFTNADSKIENVALYKLTNGKPSYKTYSKVVDSVFTFQLDSTYTPGYYRAFYQNKSTGYLDFIYNKEDVAFTLDSNLGATSAVYSKSLENRFYSEYVQNMALAQYRIDSTTVSYVKTKDSALKAKFSKYTNDYDVIQKYYEQKAQDLYCVDFIKTGAKSHVLSEDSQSYMSHITQSFLKNIDFDNEKLRNSTFVFDRAKEYVFYLHQSKDVITQNKLYVKALEHVLQKTNDTFFKGELLQFFANEFVHRENKKVLDFIIETYKQLPEEGIQAKFLEEITNKSHLLYGAIAPEIMLNSNGAKASNLKTEKYYLLIFWSSTCGHCKIEVPRLYEKLVDDKDFTVIAVGLEKEEDREKWEAEIKKMPKFHHVISPGKWEGEYANKFNINATPTYFLLNKDFRIVGKPDHDKDVEKYISQKNN